MTKAKKYGFSDVQLAEVLTGSDGLPVTEDAVRTHRLSLGVAPSVKQIDTLAAE
jgi:hypothetical protein